MNRKIELHDSRIEAVVREGDDLIVYLSHAYVHESMGTPGVDAGVGLSKRAELRIRDASPSCIDVKWPATIADGELRLGERIFNNMLPIELDFRGPSVLTLMVHDRDSAFTHLRLSGLGAQLEIHGSATYVEEFPGAG